MTGLRSVLPAIFVATPLILTALLPTPALPQISRASTKPYWLLKRPQDAGFGVGIGVARIRDNLAASRDRALTNALQNIATQIETRVWGETQIKDRETSHRLEQTYRIDLTTMVSTHLAGVEIVDTWQGTHHTWIYARLDTIKFARLRLEKAMQPRRTVYLKTSESNMQHPVHPPHLRPLIRTGLSAAGLTLTAQENQADLVLTLHARTRQGYHFESIFFSFLNMTLSLSESATGDELFHTSLTSLKGSGINYQQAGLKAFEKAGKAFNKTLLPKLLQALDQ
jgi:hypothetical protein